MVLLFQCFCPLNIFQHFKIKSQGKKIHLDKGTSPRWFSSQILANLQETDNSHCSQTIREHRKKWELPSSIYDSSIILVPRWDKDG